MFNGLCSEFMLMLLVLLLLLRLEEAEQSGTTQKEMSKQLAGISIINGKLFLICEKQRK